jgi:putative ABC transport system substrate-binding protein
MGTNLRRTALFAAALVAAAAALATNTLAQTERPRLGIITTGTAHDPPGGGTRLNLIRRALANHGWIDGQNIELEIRNARGDQTRFATLADDLIKAKPDAIWADNAPALRATFAASHTIPIMAMDFTTDPVAEGYAENYYRPGKNVTGVFLDAPQFSVKWIELLKAVVPQLTNIAVLWDPNPGDAHVRALNDIAPSFGIELQVVEVRQPQDIDLAASLFRIRPQALITLPSPMILAENARLVRLAESERLPTTSIFPFFPEGGGLISYGPEQASFNDQGAALVTKILRGANPGELPIERPDRFEVIVNLRAAKALGLAIPSDVLVRADRVIK